MVMVSWVGLDVKDLFQFADQPSTQNGSGKEGNQYDIFRKSGQPTSVEHLNKIFTDEACGHDESKGTDRHP